MKIAINSYFFEVGCWVSLQKQFIMSNITRREFEKKYNVELLPYSTASVILADILDWKGVLSQKLDYLNYNLVDKLNIDKPTRVELRNQLKNVSLDVASFPDVEEKKDFGIGVNIEIPGLKTDFDGKIGTDSIKSFKFGNIKAKTFTGELRIEIDNLLDQLKEEDFSAYKKNLRGNYLIEKLFYVTRLEITIKAGTKIDFDVSSGLPNGATVDVKGDASSGKDIKIVYNLPDCPFAAELVKLKHF
jgi:hypothetical protein